jgi:general secretion pathway protein J
MRTRPASSYCLRRRSEAAFTLLELMVALLVLTLIVTSAFGAVRLGERSWQAGLARADASEELRMVSAFLRRQFSQILPLDWPAADNAKRIAFQGSREQVRFISPAPDRRGASGLLEFRLAVEAHADGVRLVLDHRLLDPGSPEWGPIEDAERIVLAENLSHASLAYYGAPGADEEPAWHDEWPEESDNFPLLVQVKLIDSASRHAWPDLYLSVHGERSP